MTMDTLFWRNKKVIVMGLGLFGGGVGVTKFLAKQGARITVTDLRPVGQLKESLDLLAQVDVKYTLGRHKQEDFTGADVVIVNPAVPEDSSYLKLIREKKIPVETEMNLIFKLCPCPIIGITGSNGKTTTTALLGEMLKGGDRKAWIGGNIGQGSMLEYIDLIAPNDIAVLELSSFQLQDLGMIKQSPQYSVVLNIRPNHLDRHQTMANYINAKKEIIKYQTSVGYAVLNADDPEVVKWQSLAKGRTVFFGRKDSRPEVIVFIRDGQFWLRDGSKPQSVGKITDTKLLGEFNHENILAAIATAHVVGVTRERISQAIKDFPGVEHRLEFVTEIDGIKYYNDSIATNPDATMAALRAISGSIVLIAGGYDKQLPLDGLAEEIKQRVKAVILIGQTAAQIETLLAASVKVIKSATLPQAVTAARKIAVSGDTILLSPACASYDMFRNFTERGKIFKDAIFKG